MLKDKDQMAVDAFCSQLENKKCSCPIPPGTYLMKYGMKIPKLMFLPLEVSYDIKSLLNLSSSTFG